MENSIKNFFENDNIIITKILQGNSGLVRIDAKRRFPMADKPNFFYKWCSKNYAQKLALENYGKKLTDFSVYKY